ncbi:DNA cytosine methyltransferase [Lacrimispora amygdalina]|uniref:DNA cytosine methyltransferase n=1 Tax=Lacrimispora amygdalina TaxID=253257 RepID=UPI000BE251A8|nr:DNA cytosine methyltransferase [Lacrimispora amygdalina]
MPKIVIFSFFSGVGILDLAFENSGYDIVFVNEYETRFMEAYQYTRQQLNMKEPLYRYSTKSSMVYTKRKNKKKLLNMIQKEKDKGNMVGFIGGPPCPDFSIGGKNEGASGKHGRLTKTYFDLITRCQPDFFMFENVKGLVRTEKHKKFYHEMKMKITHSGYVISDKVINALSHAVPQSRERVIMIGFRENLLRDAKIFDIDKYNHFTFPWKKHEAYDSNEILKMDWPDVEEFVENIDRDFIYNVPVELTVEYWFRLNDVEHHPNQIDQFEVKKGIRKISDIEEGDTRRKSFKRLHRWRYSPTAAYGNNEVHLHPYKARRLSVAEAMAIQSLPANFVLPENIPLTYKFKMIGNGVPYLMAIDIALTLHEVIEDIIKNLEV